MKTKVIDEFRNFASKGNVVDMAVGLIIGAGFGKIVSSAVSDIILPPIGLLIGGVDFTDLAITLKAADITTGTPAVMWKYGNFIQALFDFTIVAISVFMLVKAVNKLKAKSIAKEANKIPADPIVTKEEELLTEIRDILKNK